MRAGVRACVCTRLWVCARLCACLCALVGCWPHVELAMPVPRSLLRVPRVCVVCRAGCGCEESRVLFLASCVSCPARMFRATPGCDKGSRLHAAPQCRLKGTARGPATAPRATGDVWGRAQWEPGADPPEQPTSPQPVHHGSAMPGGDAGVSRGSLPRQGHCVPVLAPLWVPSQLARSGLRRPKQLVSPGLG